MFENYQAPSEFIPADPRFGCGPSLILEESVAALARTKKDLLGTSHRKPAVKNLCKEIQLGLKKYFGLPDDFIVALGNGGATLLFDMIGLGMVEKKVAHFTCGEFSTKWAKSSQMIPWLEAHEEAVNFGEGITPTALAGYDTLCMTLNETSTGVQLDALPLVDEQTLLCVDATSGAGQVPCNVAETDVFFFSPQKVFASEGGLWVALLSPKAQKRALQINSDKTRYIPGMMNWKTVLENAEKHQTYNTPSITTLFFLNEQIKAMNEIGYLGVQNLAREKAQLIYSWAGEKNYLSAYIAEEKYRSCAVATINVDEKIPVNDLLKKLHEEKSVYGIESYRKLGKNQFRISLFHNIQYADLKKLTQLLSHAIESL